MLKIWVDVDVCLVVIKEIIFWVVNCIKIEVILIVNQYICMLLLKFINSIQVFKGFDVVDNEIVQCCNENDLVIISDILLVDEVIVKGVQVLSL